MSDNANPTVHSTLPASDLASRVAGPPEVLQRLDRGEEVDPAHYYFRIAPMFETADARLAWLNDLLAVGIGHRFVDGPVYNIFEVL